MKNKYWLGNTLLFAAALIWGCAYIAQSVGMDYVGPFTFNASRCFIASIFSLPIILLSDWAKKSSPNYVKESRENKLTLLKGGISCGIVLSFATATQQIGISQTTVGKAGFLSVMYIIIVPLIQLFFHVKLPKMIWVSLPLAVAGMYFLCMTESFSVSFGDLMVLLSAFFYAIHILVIDYFAPKTNGMKLSSLQFLIASIVNAIMMFLFENPNINDILSAWLPILYAGAISGGIAYTLQIIGQKWSEPSVASLILSLESVIAVIAGVVFLKEVPTSKQVIGCVLMFISIIIIQMSHNKERKTKQNAL